MLTTFQSQLLASANYIRERGVFMNYPDILQVILATAASLGAGWGLMRLKAALLRFSMNLN